MHALVLFYSLMLYSSAFWGEYGTKIWKFAGKWLMGEKNDEFRIHLKINPQLTHQMTRRAWFSVSSCTKSNTEYSFIEIGVTTELIANFGKFFRKSWVVLTLILSFQIFYFLTLLMPRRMQEGLLLYRLLDRRKHRNR